MEKLKISYTSIQNNCRIVSICCHLLFNTYLGTLPTSNNNMILHWRVLSIPNFWIGHK